MIFVCAVESIIKNFYSEKQTVKSHVVVLVITWWGAAFKLLVAFSTIENFHYRLCSFARESIDDVDEKRIQSLVLKLSKINSLRLPGL